MRRFALQAARSSPGEVAMEGPGGPVGDLVEPADAQLVPPVLDLDPTWAWAPYEPSEEHPWTAVLAAHLFRRAGLGASWAEVQGALAAGPCAVIDRILEASEVGPESNGRVEDALAAAARSGNATTYLAWWLRHLLESRSVLRERMGLFWHQHFAIGAAASSDLALFHRHVEGLRRDALGGWGEVMASALRDPAMYVALGGSENRLSQPNVVFARPWLEVFTVGPELTTDSDIRETARALTGWFVYRGRMRWIEREHDGGEKEILGQRGSWDREAVAQILARHPAAARTVVEGLWRWFVSESRQPSTALVTPLTEMVRGPEGLRGCVECILRSNLFYSEHAVAQKVKSPVELLIGLGRSLQMLLPTQVMGELLGQLGQRLDDPPTVRGWAGGVNWINTMTLAIRLHACRAFLEGAEGFGKGVRSADLERQCGCEDLRQAVRFFGPLLMAGDLPPEAEERLLAEVGERGSGKVDFRKLVTGLASLPEFQIN